MVDTFLVPEQTTVSTKGDGAATDIASAASRVFLVTLKIMQVIEQESIDISVWGSPDGNDWGQKPLTKFPQKFYRGEHPLLLDLSQEPALKFLRVHWEVSRWGRGDEIPMFQFAVVLKEVPVEVLQETAEAFGGR